MYQVSIKAARVNANLSKKQASELLGTTERTLYNWEEKKTAIPVDAIKQMCEIYRIPIECIRF